jgi:hypothetical protein
VPENRISHPGVTQASSDSLDDARTVAAEDETVLVRDHRSVPAVTRFSRRPSPGATL